jgi:hypothetical protein
MPKRDEDQDLNVEWEAFPYDFKALTRNLMVAEIRAMIRRLQDSGEFQIPDVDFERLDHRGLVFIKRQLRDTLRTLGGGR